MAFDIFNDLPERQYGHRDIMINIVSVLLTIGATCKKIHKFQENNVYVLVLTLHEQIIYLVSPANDANNNLDTVPIDNAVHAAINLLQTYAKLLINPCYLLAEQCGISFIPVAEVKKGRQHWALLMLKWKIKEGGLIKVKTAFYDPKTWLGSAWYSLDNIRASLKGHNLKLQMIDYGHQQSFDDSVNSGAYVVRFITEVIIVEYCGGACYLDVDVIDPRDKQHEALDELKKTHHQVFRHVN